MRLENAIALISSSAINSTHPQQWADLGCGSGLFTHALATLLPKKSVIHAIDKNIKSFEDFAVEEITVQKKQLDFVTADTDRKDLDGILMANSLHYVKNKSSFINKLSTTIKPNGSILIIEYDTNKSNPWIPYPVNFAALQRIFNDEGFKQIIKLNKQPSVFGRANIYSALIKK
jgi:trans-aconitate methyltransferase